VSVPSIGSVDATSQLSDSKQPMVPDPMVMIPSDTLANAQSGTLPIRPNRKRKAQDNLNTNNNSPNPIPLNHKVSCPRPNPTKKKRNTKVRICLGGINVKIQTGVSVTKKQRLISQLSP
jgi:hypothetical protein